MFSGIRECVRERWRDESGKNPDAHVYGNIFVMAEGVPFIRHNMSGGYMLVENNVIINTGKACEMDWHHQSEYFTYRHNRYVAMKMCRGKMEKRKKQS